jgi:hypothetical protein
MSLEQFEIQDPSIFGAIRCSPPHHLTTELKIRQLNPAKSRPMNKYD